MAQYNCSSLGLPATTPDQLGWNVSWALGNVSADDMDNMCLNRNQYLEKFLGFRRSPVFLPVCITFLIIFAVGVSGNVLTCAVIMRYKVMRTPTNYYLFSLAVSDLLVLLLGMPLELYEMWSNYPFLFGASGCYFKTFLFETVCFASILNVTALSVERYIAVLHPLKVKHVATHTHAKRVILMLWVMSMVCAMPNTSLHGVAVLGPRFGRQFPESAVCMVVKPMWMYNLIIQVTTLVFFLIPMLTITTLHLRIGLQLSMERGMQGVGTGQGFGPDSHCSVLRHQQRARHQQVTKMLWVLVIVFGICWAPFHIDRLMWSFINNWTDHHHLVFQYVHIVSGVFFYLSSVVNPILYNLMSTRFREMFQQITCRSGLCGGDVRLLTVRSTQLTLRSIVYEKPQHNGTPERITPDIEEQNMYVTPHCQHVYGNTSPD
ncbi:neuromedin-U receptor 1-like [Coregonus clupeaformis]|uniref:neuromedin-U receptor 1-like n=1 Tax=Coregonus clupeaformis TaxID=59861 RepID=UPI001E1C6336|nr:neuromedin-U receptor 1-like [Coregonus clupeaformis]